ncbi:hypothetical protein [Hymenobacter cellulosivorans]|uniref:Uncharacterized protein n=1 Tax=Hymenobacter cellulosivorans TaxID=2932249 RepID=A0ABY4F7P4_9BACT|nr:hypothetical protein [Hymenobacter cellulosivorans]UOQ52022.1 hypothetical protein MUN80_19940 [Hymenobacter cellulosivorans]
MSESSEPLPLQEEGPMPISFRATPYDAAGPAPVVAMGYYFYFPVPGRCQSQIHHTPHNTGRARLGQQYLRLQFSSLLDAVHFRIDRTELLPGWIGTYQLRCPTVPAAPGRVTYCYTCQEKPGSGVSRLRFRGVGSRLTGGVTITAYDPQRQLLSGYYEVRASNQPAPAHRGLAEHRCTIVLAGDFNDLCVGAKPAPDTLPVPTTGGI